ncbi:MAG: hypothetical protein ACOYJW_00605 [Candidatus Omnitrophota bacterium]|jgi:hypothetical protein
MRRFLPLCFFLLLLVSVLGGLSGLNYWVFHEIQNRLEIRVTGRFTPDLFRTGFQIRHGSFFWKEKVQLVDGHVQVRYDPWTIFSRDGIRIILKSDYADIRLLGNWAKWKGVESARVELLDVDFVLGSHRLTAINEIEVRSSSFQFVIKNVDRSTGVLGSK